MLRVLLLRRLRLLWLSPRLPAILQGLLLELRLLLGEGVARRLSLGGERAVGLLLLRLWLRRVGRRGLLKFRLRD